MIVTGKFLRLLSSLAALALVAGCSSTGISSPFSGSDKKADAAATPTPVVVQRSCPMVFLREGTAVYRQYARGAKKDPSGVGDPDKLVMQATLDQTTRQCFQTEQEDLRVTVVVHGRIVLGPAGKPGTYKLPIRVAASDGDQTLYSELSQFEVTVPPGGGASQFIFTKENVLLPKASDLARLFAGIDEGPYNTK